jgi:hypothetical protein
MEMRSRAVLGLLIEKAVVGSPHGEPMVVDPNCCPNCGAWTESERSPYCGSCCREQAGFVRQLRAGITDGAALNEERQVAMGQNFWHLLGGGYPLRQSIVPPRARDQVFKRVQGKCELCGAPAISLDHTGSG